MVDIPECLASLDRDRRGYPIPVTAAVDRDGTPHFTVSDQEVRQRMIDEDRCHLSGRKLLRGRWFIGSPMAAFHPRGAFLDGPMLDEASLFAVQTCPFVAAPKYARRIEDKLIQQSIGEDRMVVRMHEEPVPDRPDVFVRVMAIGHKLVSSSEGDVLFVPKKPYRKVEFWRHGKMIDFDEGVELSVTTSNGQLTFRDMVNAMGKIWSPSG
ncbi:hypothetical protein OIU34_21545 [Pararhizobium sp. BT-229]|uniref:hypothetical protein n=1 Tax=Pararhizobium sp. BT-229 TaxID=2986923 RepID=UPI0021F6FB55|nr:hypothetical protein [Pararhizobium sp. BT-229]MCV9964478.1 hypothetical protein [Pararhizobium sp. BT-229]